MHATSKTYKPAFITLYIIAAVLIAYNILRAVHVSITYDEATTWKLYLHDSYTNIIRFAKPTANNHPLNSICSKFSIGLLGNGIVALRLPNMLSQLIYLYCSQAFLRKQFNNQWFVLFGFLILNLNPFLFDFWGLCRGYGMALGFMMLSLYQLQSFIQVGRLRNLVLCLGAAILSVYSNFAMLNFYLAIIAVMAIHIVTKPSTFIKSSVAILTCAVVLYLLIAAPIQALKQHNELYYGGDNGLIADTLSSLVRESLFISKGGHSTLILLLVYGMLAQLVVAGCYWLYNLIRRNVCGMGLISWLLIATPLISIVVQHVLLGNKYLIERTAIFLFPLYIVQLLCFVKGIVKQYWLANTLTGVLALLLSAVFIKNINLTSTRSWAYNQYDLLIINRMIEKLPTEFIKLKLYWEFLPSFEYYIAIKYPDRIEPLNNNAFLTKPSAYDCYYIHRDDANSIPETYRQDTVLDGGRFLLYMRK